MLLKITTVIASTLFVLSPIAANAERGSGRIELAPKLTCPLGEGCTIVIPNPPQSGPKPLISVFVPDPTSPPRGNPEGTGTR